MSGHRSPLYGQPNVPIYDPLSGRFGAGGGGPVATPGEGGGLYVGTSQQRYVGDLAPNGKQGFFCISIKQEAGSDAAFQQYFITGSNQRFLMTRSFTNVYTIEGWDIAGVQKLKLTLDGTLVVASGWVTVIASWDLALGLAHLYHGNTDVEKVGTVKVDAEIDYTDSQVNHSGNSVGGNRTKACVSEVIWHNSYLDVSNAGVRATIVDPTSGFPVDWGTGGATLLGGQALWYSPTGDFVDDQQGSKPAMTQFAGTWVACDGPNA